MQEEDIKNVEMQLRDILKRLDILETKTDNLFSMTEGDDDFVFCECVRMEQLSPCQVGRLCSDCGGVMPGIVIRADAINPTP